MHFWMQWQIWTIWNCNADSSGFQYDSHSAQVYIAWAEGNWDELIGMSNPMFNEVLGRWTNKEMVGNCIISKYYNEYNYAHRPQSTKLQVLCIPMTQQPNSWWILCSNCWNSFKQEGYLYFFAGIYSVWIQIWLQRVRINIFPRYQYVLKIFNWKPMSGIPLSS